ncbi:Mediator of RNA polymerase II transcription subunit 12 [Grifola frondosa]|uniref:Mediator of RNA polymerase II transcription subunit 12 n=1 Tax=Grifola frondosa TaxID=5627 RepID=A0A1C7LU45_GRIFR|nr:Mediator of RNA polymerase II transcription subunit 12 [Grifola frondosa]
MAKGEKELPSLPIYESRPPDWLPQTHISADLGYVGFFPPRPDQHEELLTEANVKNGLILGLSVPAETYSAQDAVRNRLVQENALGELEDLMNQIFARRIENLPSIPVTLNDAKRQAWFDDLANPDVPLHRMGKNVPHGAKGHDLLDLLHSNNVAIPRAVWFLRVFGGNESAGLRNKPTYNPTQYSTDWANLVTSYIKKQLTDIALPSAPRPALNVKQTFKGVLSEAESRDRWISRFTYCLNLLRTFYSEGLVDNLTFLSWLVQQMGSCTLAQVGFVARLADEYLDGMLVSRALTRPFVEACLNKLSEVSDRSLNKITAMLNESQMLATSAKDYLVNVEIVLRSLISRAFLALPDAFVSPRMWIQHSTFLEQLLMDALPGDSSGSTGQQNVNALHHTFLERLSDVKRRNEAMLFRHLPPRVLGVLSSALSDIKLLNSLSGKTDMESVTFFEDASELSPSFARKLDTLLTWSVTPLQYGDHRPYAAACIILLWRNRAEDRAIRRDAPSPDEHIQDLLFDWLDASDVAAEPENIAAVALLFGQLVKRALFSYTKYIQRLIARGEAGIAFSEASDDIVLHLYDHISQSIYLGHGLPSQKLPTSCTPLISQRKVTLYGVRARDIPEDSNEREIRKEIRALLPELFGGNAQPIEAMSTTFWTACSTLLSAPRFEQVKTVKQWLLPILKKHISSQAQDSFSADNVTLKVYTLTSILLARIKCYGSILELALCMLEHSYTNELLIAVIETLRQHMEVWACMNIMKTVAAALFAAHQFWRARGVQSRALLTLLVEIDNDRYLEPGSREHIQTDISTYTHALSPINDNPDTVPQVLPEILLLATDPNPEAPSLLANALWYKYLTASDWAWKVWDNTIASLRQIPVIFPDVDGRRACALRYGTFLTHVDQHLPNGFDDQVLTWFLGAGKNEVAALNAEAWDVVTVVLLYLAVHGALTTTTILQGLVYPTWQAGASASSAEYGQSLATILSAVNNIFEHLLLKDECGREMPPMNLFQAQGLQTRRRDVFREPHFSSLVANFPALVLIEQNKYLSLGSREASTVLRQTICHVSVFRQGIYRNLDTVRLAFEKLLESQTIADDLHEPLVNALRLMLNDSGQGRTLLLHCQSFDPDFYLIDGPVDATEWRAVSSLLSPWKLAATAIEIRLTLKQLGEGLCRDATRSSSCASLDKLTTAVFYHCKTPEEADFVAEMMTDVSRAVAGKFVNAGLHRIIEIFHEASNPSDPKCLMQLVANAGEVLRLLSNIVEPFRQDNPMPQLEATIQDGFMTAFCTKLEEITEVLTAHVDNNSDESARSQTSHTAVFLARLLQFNLGFPGAWTSEAKAQSERLCTTITRLALYHGAGSTLDLLAFPLLLDTLFYALDEVPVDLKATSIDLFHNYPEFDLSDLPADMPPEYRMQLRSLLPYVSLNTAVCNLVYASRDSSGAITNSVPVQNRPWEWTENLGDNTSAEAKGDDRAGDDRLPVKNSASLPLELFGARMTGDQVLPSQASADDPMLEENLRTFQDDLFAGSIFQRDWRETRIGLNDGGAARSKGEHDEETLPVFAGPGSSERRSTSRRVSPASSVRSAASAHHSALGSVPSLRQSPVHLLSRLSVSTAGEPIDVDSFEMPTSSSRSATKRKATSSLPDDEIQVIEGPVASSRSSKKTKAKPAAKSRAKKR